VVNELATVAAEPGMDEEKVAEMIMEKVKTEKDRKRFEEGIKGQAVVAKQEGKERDAEKKLAAAQAGVSKEKERQMRRVEEIEEEKQAATDKAKKQAQTEATAEKNLAREEAHHLHDAKTMLTGAKDDLLRESKSLQDFQENQKSLEVDVAKAESTDDPVQLKAAKEKMKTAKSLEDGSLTNIKTFKAKIATLTEKVDELEGKAVARYASDRSAPHALLLTMCRVLCAVCCVLCVVCCVLCAVCCGHCSGVVLFRCGVVG